MKSIINLNQHAKVKLTDEGKRIHNSDEYHRLHTLPDDEGYVSYHLWELMRLFGEHLYNGCKVPFVENKIHVIEWL